MKDINTRTVSLSSSNLNWDLVDKRANEIGFDRSKYTQRLYELDLKYNVLSNKKLLHMIEISGKEHLKFFDIVTLLFLLTILVSILSMVWLLL